jgi:putative ABC transport system permease protein
MEAMIKNYFKTAWRNIVKHRFYSIVNVVGLFAGITFTLLIGAYVWSELQVNKKLNNADKQYILTSEWKDLNMGQEITTLGPIAKRLKEDYPGLVKNYYRWDGITSIVSKGDKNLREGIQLGDSTLLSIYGFELMYGDVKTALNAPYSVVLTEDRAIKYFGKADVVGQSITIQSFSGDKREFNITGVLKKFANNSVTQINNDNLNCFFIPTNAFSFFGRADFEAWNNIYLPSYVELAEGITAKDLEKPVQQLIGQNAPDFIKENLKIRAVALTDYYLQKDNGLVKRMLYTLSFIGLFILLMAIVNFINMAISSSSARIREIGVRKVMGGVRKQIIIQFLTESTVLVLIATVLSLSAYPFLKPIFQDLIGKTIPALSSFSIYFIFIPLAGVLLVGLLAGLYPAVVLSAIKSADAVKGKLKTVRENVTLRKGLVGFQFCMALVVMVAAFIVSQQLSYFFSNRLGYNKEYIVSSQVPRNWTPEGVRKMQTIRNEFASLSQISSATLSYEIPNGMNGGQPPLYKAGTDSAKAIAMQLMITDENYLSTYQIPLKAGNFFNGSHSDSGKIIMNEKAVVALGWQNAAEAIGQQVKIPGDQTIFTIKGVTNDFHFGSMQQKIAPIFFFNVEFVPTYRYLSFKLKPGNIPEAIAAIQKKWATLLPGSSFEYTFMDDTLKKLYTTEIQLKKAAYTATLLSLIIVLLGVLGLVSLSINKRVKEISIRKVLGASVPHITLLFVKEFMIVVVIAAIIACPIAYFIMQGWLNNYASRINITAEPFVWPTVILGAVTLLLITLQTLKAAIANPVKNLKSE